jgi:hypothetical protein
VLRERANPVSYAPGNPDDNCLSMPVLPKDEAPSVPALMEKAPKPPPDLPATFKTDPGMPIPSKTDKAAVVPASANVPKVGLDNPTPLSKPKLNRPVLAPPPDLDTAPKPLSTGVPVDSGWTPRP